MGDPLARLLADIVSKIAEIQNLYIRVLGRVEGTSFLILCQPGVGWGLFYCYFRVEG